MSKKILIVDDEKDIVEVVANRLEANGYDVICAYDGKEGVQKARHESPDLVLLDLSMPEMNGYDVCSELKKGCDPIEAPIIVLTANISSRIEQQATQCGAQGFIPKPFASERLLDEIKKFI